MNSVVFDKRDTYYFNGNYLVLHLFGKTYKRCLRVNEELKAEFPDSIDLKITNKCNYNCPFCHESSTSSGKSFDLDNTIRMLEQLPRVPIEIAIGGGNVLEIPNETLQLIKWCKEYGFKTRITVNQRDLHLFNNHKKPIKTEGSFEYMDTPCEENNIPVLNIGNEIDGIGVSLVPEILPDLSTMPVDNVFFSYRNYILFNRSVYDNTTNVLNHKNIVSHIIAGLFPIDKLKILLSESVMNGLNNLLILGYKQFGRAKNTELPESLPEFEKIVKEFIQKARNSYTSVFNIAFDNLALEQLHMKDFISDEDWDFLYLGKEGSCSMYIDAVNETYARSSTSLERTSWKDIGLLEFFKSLRNEVSN